MQGYDWDVLQQAQVNAIKSKVFTDFYIHANSVTFFSCVHKSQFVDVSIFVHASTKYKDIITLFLFLWKYALHEYRGWNLRNF